MQIRGATLGPMRGGTRVAFVAGIVLMLATARAAVAADPGRWKETGTNSIPISYYQGVTSDSARNFFFNGVYFGLYRTDADLHETGRNDDVIPSSVHATEGYNHIGDIDWDEGEGGRILLPLECYYPGTPGGNPCNHGSIGVADPQTLQWRYYVKLDPAEIPKAMWVQESPDGSLLWTSVQNDLLAYRTSDVNPSYAAPAGPKIKAVKRLKGVVPPTGVTGAVFYQGRIYVAGQDGRLFQVWSIDLDTGQRRLEIERNIVGESEGVDILPVLGGLLHWMIQPYNEESIPTYGVANGTLLHFVPRASDLTGGAGSRAGPLLRLGVRPRRIQAGTRVRFRFRVTMRDSKGRRRAVHAWVRLAGHRRKTNRRGRTRITLRLRRAGRYRALATRRGARSASARVRVLAP
jgi:hypothetical protein